MPVSNVATVRKAVPADAVSCGRICYEAFAKINVAHGFAPDFPSPEAAAGLLGMLFSHPGFYCAVAEADGRIVGSNCLDERSTIAGVGPITVAPTTQNVGTGRLLMEHILARAEAGGFAGVRLVQAAFHARSLSLYTKLGFQVREPLAVMNGPALGLQIEGCTVRPATMDDAAACNRVCAQIHGHDRAGDLRDAIQQGTARVVERNGRISGYVTITGFFGHMVGETLPDAQALIATAEAFAGAGILVPMRNTELFGWCLEQGLRTVMPLNLMTRGMYQEPNGPYLPSILY